MKETLKLYWGTQRETRLSESMCYALTERYNIKMSIFTKLIHKY